MVEVFFTELRVRLSPQQFDIFWEKKVDKKKNYIKPDEAEEFLEKSMGISKNDLYQQRLHEIMNMDMMATQTIADHPESLIEFQIFSLCIIGSLNKILNFATQP